MNIEELKKRLGFDSRVHRVKCHKCGKELEAPSMYGKDKDILEPYCCTTTVLIIQWLIGHGWHVTKHEANPSGAYFCPDCFPKGQPEYSRRPYCDDWCRQAEKWMKENGGKR